MPGKLSVSQRGGQTLRSPVRLRRIGAGKGLTPRAVVRNADYWYLKFKVTRKVTVTIS